LDFEARRLAGELFCFLAAAVAFRFALRARAFSMADAAELLVFVVFFAGDLRFVAARRAAGDLLFVAAFFVAVADAAALRFALRARAFCMADAVALFVFLAGDVFAFDFVLRFVAGIAERVSRVVKDSKYKNGCLVGWWVVLLIWLAGLPGLPGLPGLSS
jgi:hypothetical protein